MHRRKHPGEQKGMDVRVFERAASKNSNVQKRQFWQQHNKPIELWSPEVTEQKMK